MDGDLLLIFSFVIVLALIVFPFVLITQRRSVKHEERKLELELQIEQAKKGQSTATTESYQHLEDRLRVLERIATDPTSNLAKEIEDLRSQEMAKN